MGRGMWKYLVNLPAVTGRRMVIALPLIWLAVFFFLPLVETLKCPLRRRAAAFRLMSHYGALVMMGFLPISPPVITRFCCNIGQIILVRLSTV